MIDVNAAAYPANFPLPEGVRAPTADEIANYERQPNTGLADASVPAPPTSPWVWGAAGVGVLALGYLGYRVWASRRERAVVMPVDRYAETFMPAYDYVY